MGPPSCKDLPPRRWRLFDPAHRRGLEAVRAQLQWDGGSMSCRASYKWIAGGAQNQGEAGVPPSFCTAPRGSRHLGVIITEPTGAIILAAGRVALLSSAYYALHRNVSSIERGWALLVSPFLICSGQVEGIAQVARSNHQSRD